MKLTKRKGFNFFRSYYDVFNELETDKDKLAFIEALLAKQFLGINPTELKGMAKFAYISQSHSIDTQVKGYETKTKTTLCPIDGGLATPTVGGWQGGKVTPTVQEKGKGKEKGKEQYVKQNIYRQFAHLKITQEEFDKLEVDYTKQQIDTILDRIENYKNNKNYKSLYLTAKNWIGKEFEKKNLNVPNEMPKDPKLIPAWLEERRKGLIKDAQ